MSTYVRYCEDNEHWWNKIYNSTGSITNASTISMTYVGHVMRKLNIYQNSELCWKTGNGTRKRDILWRRLLDDIKMINECSLYTLRFTIYFEVWITTRRTWLNATMWQVNVITTMRLSALGSLICLLTVKYITHRQVETISLAPLTSVSFEITYQTRGHTRTGRHVQIRWSPYSLYFDSYGNCRLNILSRQVRRAAYGLHFKNKVKQF